MSNNLQFFQGFTLVDITATGVTRNTKSDDQLERNQHRNWETVVQCLGLRTQPQHIQPPTWADVDVEVFDFGDMYTGTHRTWTWTWAIEGTGIYDLPRKPLGGLQQDFEQVPVISYLTETARFMLPIFYPYGSIKNIYFKQINND